MGCIRVLGLAAACVLAAIASAPASAAEAPRVVATSPAEGITIPSGDFTLTVTFDQAMAPGSYSFVTSESGKYPPCGPQATQSDDGMSFTLTCKAEAGESYALWINRAPYLNFKSTDGVAATPLELHFKSAP